MILWREVTVTYPFGHLIIIGVYCSVDQSCLTLCEPMDYSPPAPQAPLSKELSRQEYWGGLPFPDPGNLPDPGTKPTSLLSPALVGRFFTTSATWEAKVFINCFKLGWWVDRDLRTFSLGVSTIWGKHNTRKETLWRHEWQKQLWENSLRKTMQPTHTVLLKWKIQY